MDSVKEQYERFPYPPVGFLALPKRGQGARLAYETGMALVHPPVSAAHQGRRILVAGAGTLEALVVAQAHPHASEIVAVDLSQSSIDRLKKRVLWARLNGFCRLRWLRKGRRLPPIRFVVADLGRWEDGAFDYIVASNVLHHVADPQAILARLASWLRPGGLMRVMTYPKQSRLWLRWTGAWLRWHGISAQTANLKQQARGVIELLPEQHPIRQCYVSHSETGHAAGIVDAFLHACETPLAPMEWQMACVASGLQLLGEQQHALSSSMWLTELLASTAQLSAWQRLQILDDTLELATNPIFWLRRVSEPQAIADDAAGMPRPDEKVPPASSERTDWLSQDNVAFATLPALGRRYILPSLTYWQLREGVERARHLLGLVACSIEELLRRVAEEVDYGVDQGSEGGSNLVLSAYRLDDICNAAEPWGEAQWQALENFNLSLIFQGQAAPGATLVEQAQWLQLRHGPFHPLLEVEFVTRSESMS